MRISAALLLFFFFASAAEAQPSLPPDSSSARIVITASAYKKGNTRETREDLSLPEISRQTIYRYFGKNDRAPAAGADNRVDALRGDNSESGRQQQCSQSILSWAKTLPVPPRFSQPAGVFVTLSKNGKTRACWGSVYPREGNAVRETVLSTMGALSKEYRFAGIKKLELKDLKIQVTVVRGIEAVSDIKAINPLKDGILVRSGGRGGVILPGEAIDAYYESILARLKAGIRQSEPCQIYKIRAEIYD